jgi:hypothetical protein
MKSKWDKLIEAELNIFAAVFGVWLFVATIASILAVIVSLIAVSLTIFEVEHSTRTMVLWLNAVFPLLFYVLFALLFCHLVVRLVLVFDKYIYNKFVKHFKNK